VLSSDERGQRIRFGLREARRRGQALGGRRPGREALNRAAHCDALERAFAYREVLDAGATKTLSALSQDLFQAGCTTATGKPLNCKMVSRLRERLAECRRPGSGEVAVDLSAAVKDRNALSFRWLYELLKRKVGEGRATELCIFWPDPEEAEWLRDVLDLCADKGCQSQHR
jgi:hypothetical protein